MSEKLRVGIVGAGAITQVGHLPVLKRMKGVEIVGICDNDRAKARALADRFEVPDVWFLSAAGILYQIFCPDCRSTRNAYELHQTLVSAF